MILKTRFSTDYNHLFP